MTAHHLPQIGWMEKQRFLLVGFYVPGKKGSTQVYNCKPVLFRLFSLCSNEQNAQMNEEWMNESNNYFYRRFMTYWQIREILKVSHHFESFALHVYTYCMQVSQSPLTARNYCVGSKNKSFARIPRDMFLKYNFPMNTISNSRHDVSANENLA